MIINTASGCNSVVERLLPKQDVAGSNPVIRSIYFCYYINLPYDLIPLINDRKQVFSQ
jgi:hypothetical protein